MQEQIAIKIEFAPPEEVTVEELPSVIVVPELPQEALIQRRSERELRELGNLALKSDIDIADHVREKTPEKMSSSLLETTKRAGNGDAVALASLKLNIMSDVTERSWKDGVVIEIELETDDEHGFAQHGQPVDNVHDNAVLYASNSPRIMLRSGAEHRNNHRRKGAYQQGYLADYYELVSSPTDETMSDKELIENHMFADTKPFVMQVTTEKEDGGLVMQSAFVAGVKELGGPRHDFATIAKMGEALGVDFSGLDSIQLLDTPILIHKSLMPNGVIDLVRLYDECAGGTFFGADRPVEDYDEFVAKCKAREASLEAIVDEIAEQMMAEAHTWQSPADAIRRLDELSEDKMVERAIEDHEINPRVFGEKAAPYIEAARIHRANGSMELADQAMLRAKETAQSFVCPSALKKQQEAEAAANGDAPQNNSPESVSREGKMRCINCDALVDKNKVIQAKCWKCPSCNFAVDICTGEIIDKGKKPDETGEENEAAIIPFRKAA